VAKLERTKKQIQSKNKKKSTRVQGDSKMSAGITFGSFALEAFTKLQKSRAAKGGDGEVKDELIHIESDAGAASASAAASPAPEDARATTPTHCISRADASSPFIQPNSFAGKRELSQLLRTHRERPATAGSYNRQQPNRPRWHRPPIFAFDTKPTAGQIESSLGKGTRLHVTGSPVKMTARTKPLLWLSLQVNWSRSGAAQKAALKRIYEFTKRRPLITPAQTPTYHRRGYHKGHIRRSKSKKKSKVKRYTVACDFCTYINSVRRRNAHCQMCGAQLPDPEMANNMDQVLPCGLTARQLYELQNREITPEDFEMLCILDEGVAKKTLDKAAVDKFETGEVTEAGQQCGVCQCDLEIGEMMTCLPCGHKFHSECINEWLLKYNNSCPYKCSWDVDVAET